MELGNELQLLMAASSSAKNKEVVASYSCVCYYFSMELFLLVSGTVQAPHPVALVQEEMFPILL